MRNKKCRLDIYHFRGQTFYNLHEKDEIEELIERTKNSIKLLKRELILLKQLKKRIFK